MTLAEELAVRSVAQSPTKVAVCAETVLSQTGKEKYWRMPERVKQNFLKASPSDAPDTKEEKAPASITLEPEEKITSDKQVYFGRNYPDPFKRTTNIPYFIPHNSERAVLKIYNMVGNLLREINLEKGFHILELKAPDLWAEGIYFYAIEMGGVTRQYEKMILLK